MWVTHTGESAGVTDHVIVTILFASWSGEGTPEIEMVVIESGGDKVIKGQAALTDESVTQITCPSN